MLSLLLVLALASEPAQLHPSGFEVGQVGEFTVNSTRGPFYLRIISIKDKDTLIVGMVRRGRYADWVIRGYPTEGLADGKVMHFPGTYKISTEKIDGKTYYVATRVKGK